MAVYSPSKGILAQLTEERDACGVGFIASLDNEPRHDILQQALAACTCMEHRGASSADNISGDGAGVMTAIPWNLFSDLLDAPQANKDGSQGTAVGMFFLPQGQEDFEGALKMIEEVLVRRHFVVKGWREVPVDPSVVGEISASFVPRMQQVVLQSDEARISADEESLDRRLYDARREIQGHFRQTGMADIAYVNSLSTRTIVYKGMLRSCDLGLFYKDLQDPAYTTPFAIYHRRFSTNTNPKWQLAQPMRLLAHNGEINTLLGNINWVKSRQYSVRTNLQSLRDTLTHDGQRKVRAPLVDVARSDSANLDSILESFVKTGYSPEEALMMLVPEAYASQPALKDNAQVTAFYEYYESLQEAWDGPALLVFSDGNVVGACLDRNGLRPARYMLTSHQTGGEEKLTVHVMSEVGVTKALPQFSEDGSVIGQTAKLLDSGRLGPGQMLAVKLSEGRLMLNDEVKSTVAAKRPYVDWVKESIKDVPKMSFESDLLKFTDKYIDSKKKSRVAIAMVKSADVGPIAAEPDNQNLITTQSYFGWGSEDVEVQISSMARDGVEATTSMGDDAPLAALSVMPHTLYDYFKQRFAQVTNPPIDSLREGAVMSLNMFLGPKGSPLSLQKQDGVRLKIPSPVLNSMELDAISGMETMKLTTVTTLYPLLEGLTQGGLKAALDRICSTAEDAVRAGNNIINLSDKADDAEDLVGLTYIPPLMAVAAVHHRLIKSGLRTQASITVTTGQMWSTHHVAALVGFGANAVVPYTAFDAVINWHGQKRVQNAMTRGDFPSISAEKALLNYRQALDKGLLKIMSKMGISLLTSYHGAQIFESLGLADEVVTGTFPGTASRVGGLDYDDLAAEVAEFSRVTFGNDAFADMVARVEGEVQDGKAGKATKLFNYGFLNYFKSGDYHHNNQPLVKLLHKALREKNYDVYKLYEESVTMRPPTTVRDVLQFSSARQPVPLESVESVEAIMKRFCTGGMSLGALSREAHETLAIAVNRIGGRSNSGEGGEDPIRMLPITDVDAEGKSARFPHLKGLHQGDMPSSRIKQVASGRFGVTPQYLMSADQLEIKIAQGAKPGEGGQLPGPKIDSYIAGLRNSKPGVTLISPPPHHDIYSIEDLAQLIFDLHQINPQAGVSVKLVSEVGIGTVASGVAKAGADVIQISGHDGGTGASPMTSIRHAGSSWELGLVESHAALKRNSLRGRVLLRVDGGLKSGWDVVMAAAMGAEEFGFGTIALIAEGCIMARICHTNKCPVGVTTQRAELREKFPGTPEEVVTFFSYVAEEVRQILARLGYTSLDEIIGLPNLLEPREGLQLKKTKNVDVSFVTDALAEGTGDDRAWLKHGPVNDNGVTLDDIILSDPEVAAAVEEQLSVRRQVAIKNTDRAAFARISGQIAKKYGDGKFQGRMRFDLTGGAGQSFGAFLGQGMELHLSGYANDYVGKGMAGGLIVIRPPDADIESGGARAAAYSMVGNTVLYGATGGALHVRGRGGERFAVRNSGALGVVEGLGDHGCEYMTGGVIVVLGSVGRNFGAGMTGGLAFVLGDEGWLDGATPDSFDLPTYTNTGTIKLIRLTPQHTAARAYLAEVLGAHVGETDSPRAALTLKKLDQAMENMWVAVPASETGNALLAEVEVSAKKSMFGAALDLLKFGG
ncbi:ferredoxin-dependent glutamate synthase [Ochromonadaceae sp. CCMP2298]|nr:ferredoxin-dependent glutamate synthase [Ochromonadaceae sp. CCMP2298]